MLGVDAEGWVPRCNGHAGKNLPADFIINEPETEETIDSLGMTPNEVKEAANSVISISVSASKP